MSQPSGRAPPSGRTPAEPEWTFLREGQVFGPIPEVDLRRLVESGEIGGATFVSSDGSTYRPMAEITGFLVELKKAEARQRVEKEITDSRRLAARRRLFRGTAGLLAAGGLVSLFAGGAIWLASARPWQRRSALLEDFGAGVAIAVPARIGSLRQERPAEPLEVAVPVEPEAPPRAVRPGRDAPRERPASAAPRAPAPRSGEDATVLAQWDPADIQAVVGRQQRTLAPCLRQEASRSPDFSGQIPIEFAIGNDGRVEALWIDEPRFKRGPLHDCLLQVLRSWRFRPFPGQRPIISLGFRIGGA